MNRPSWDEYFMEITEKIAERSTCLRRRVGAVIVKDKRIMATGYNGAPQGLPHCSEVGCLRMSARTGEQLEICRAVHAECNAIIFCAKYGIVAEGSTLYLSCTPCNSCAKILINAGIKRIVINADYPAQQARDILKEAGVELVSMKKT